MPKLIRSVVILSLLWPTLLYADCVVLLHGLARTSSSMVPLEKALENSGFTVVNVDYPSRKLPIEELSPLAVKSGIDSCPEAMKIHFVTHSLGGILVRYYFEGNSIQEMGRVVMIAPPNQGSEVVDNLRNAPGFEMLNGPAGQQLGTDEESIPLNLGSVDYEVGVIAGTRTFNPILSLFLPNPDDGKVSVAGTYVDGVKETIEVPHSHPFIMKANVVIEQSINFLHKGEFDLAAH
jgi:hypothetical protein